MNLQIQKVCLQWLEHILMRRNKMNLANRVIKEVNNFIKKQSFHHLLLLGLGTAGCFEDGQFFKEMFYTNYVWEWDCGALAHVGQMKVCSNIDCLFGRRPYHTRNKPSIISGRQTTNLYLQTALLTLHFHVGLVSPPFLV